MDQAVSAAVDRMLPWVVERADAATSGSACWDRHSHLWKTTLFPGDRALFALEPGCGPVRCTVEGSGYLSFDTAVGCVHCTVSGLTTLPAESVGSSAQITLRVKEGTVLLWQGTPSPPVGGEGVCVNVVLVHYNRFYTCSRLVDFILSSLDWCGTDLQIYIIDNASAEDDILGLASERVHILRMPSNVGATGAQGVGIHESLKHRAADYIWILDDDVLPRCDTLYHLLEAVQQADVVGSTMMNLEEPLTVHESGCFVATDGSLVFNQHNTPYRRTDLKPILDCDFVAFASVLVARAVVERCGVHPDWFIHYDDVEWCARVRESGFRVVASGRSFIWHPSERVKPITWMTYYDVRNQLKFLSARMPWNIPLWRRRWTLAGLSAWVRGKAPEAINIARGISDWKRGLQGKGAAFYPLVRSDSLECLTGTVLVSEHLFDNPDFTSRVLQATTQGVRVVSITQTPVVRLPDSIDILPRARTKAGRAIQLLRLRGSVDAVVTGSLGHMRFPWLASDTVVVVLTGNSAYSVTRSFRSWCRGFTRWALAALSGGLWHDIYGSLADL